LSDDNRGQARGDERAAEPAQPSRALHRRISQAEV
jgi:hypothetical protein